jgi:hypothetical protein
MIVFPRSVQEAASQSGVFRAGGTDLHELRHLRIVRGPLVDLRDVPGLDGVRADTDETLRLGAKLTIGGSPDRRMEPVAGLLRRSAGGRGRLEAIDPTIGETLDENLARRRNRAWPRCLRSFAQCPRAARVRDENELR